MVRILTILARGRVDDARGQDTAQHAFCYGLRLGIAGWRVRVRNPNTARHVAGGFGGCCAGGFQTNTTPTVENDRPGGAEGRHSPLDLNSGVVSRGRSWACLMSGGHCHVPPATAWSHCSTGIGNLRPSDADHESLGRNIRVASCRHDRESKATTRHSKNIRQDIKHDSTGISAVHERTSARCSGIFGVAPSGRSATTTEKIVCPPRAGLYPRIATNLYESPWFLIFPPLRQHLKLRGAGSGRHTQPLSFTTSNITQRASPAMPTLRIMSLYQQHQQAFADELSRGRSEREQFAAALVARFGREAAEAMRRDAQLMPEIFPGRSQLPQLSREICVATKKLQMLNRKVLAVRREIRTADCWFRESPGPVSVLDAVGLRWRAVHEKSADGWLPVSGALWLLQVLRTTGQTEKQAEGWKTVGGEPLRLSTEWQRRLDSRRRRLIFLLHTAVMLEEDVRWEYRL